MKTRNGMIPDHWIGLALLLLFVVLTAISVVNDAKANLHMEARAASCFAAATDAAPPTAGHE
jgi:hypothetical protein